MNLSIFDSLFNRRKLSLVYHTVIMIIKCPAVNEAVRPTKQCNTLYIGCGVIQYTYAVGTFMQTCLQNMCRPYGYNNVYDNKSVVQCTLV